MLGLTDVALFVLIGVIVSLDVAGLTATKASTYVGSDASRFWWAWRNAFWHALMLAGYGLAAVGFFDWFIQGALRWLVENLPSFNVADWIVSFFVELRMHFAVIFALLAIFVVWNIYSDKILENPLNAERESRGDVSHLDWQRRFIYWILTRLRFSQNFIARQMESAAVAIDMLALAFLLKALGQFQENPVIVFEISLVIFVTVFITVFMIAKILQSKFSEVLILGDQNGLDSVNRILLIIRLTEPLLIFYFVCELLCFVVWNRMSSSALFFIAAAILTYALVRSVKLQAIIDVTVKMTEELAGKMKNAK